MFDKHLSLETRLHGLTLLAPEVDRLFNSFYDIAWELSFSLKGGFYSELKTSSVVFKDKEALLSRRLITEIFLFAELHEIRSLILSRVAIGLGFGSSMSRDGQRHQVFLEGEGHHSKFDDNKSNFKFSFFTTDHMNDIIGQIIELPQ